MEEAVVSSLEHLYGPAAVTAVYVKGSANKRWDTRIDYVPEVSDLDLHVRLADEELVYDLHESVDGAAGFQESLEAGFARRRPQPLHVPRLQIIFLNLIEQWPCYLPSPPETVRVLKGPPYAEPDYSDRDKIIDDICLWAAEHRRVVLGFGNSLFDKVFHHTVSLLRNVQWRIGPMGPQGLILSGEEIGAAWSLNRTETVAHLRERGMDELAGHYEAYYVEAWRYYASGFHDGQAGRAAARAAYGVMSTFLDIVDDYRLPRHTEG
jgi:hypothetical protein